jgi:hypothetical protein
LGTGPTKDIDACNGIGDRDMYVSRMDTVSGIKYARERELTAERAGSGEGKQKGGKEERG